MIVYHGSTTLPDKTIPRGSVSNGVFLTPIKEFAAIFGRTIHSFEVSEHLILDLRQEKVLAQIKNKNLNSLLNLIDLSESGLPFAFNHVTELSSLEAVRDLALALGYAGAYFYETPNANSIEIWNPSCLTWIRSEPNPDFDRLNS